jgi:hypothetical protein
VTTSILDEALRLSREGDVDGAANLLREARAAQGALNDAQASLLFQLVTKLDATDEGLEIASAALLTARSPLAKSQWAMRRGLLHIERGDREEALADLQVVMKLKANEGHVDQARAALLKVAQLAKKK